MNTGAIKRCLISVIIRVIRINTTPFSIHQISKNSNFNEHIVLAMMWGHRYFHILLTSMETDIISGNDNLSVSIKSTKLLTKQPHH